MATTEGSLRSASLSGYKIADHLVIDAKHVVPLVGDVYVAFFLHFVRFDVLTGILWQLFCPFLGDFSGYRWYVSKRYLLTGIV